MEPYKPNSGFFVLIYLSEWNPDAVKPILKFVTWLGFYP